MKTIGVLAGPLLEGELVGKQPAALVVASAFRRVARMAKRVFTSNRFQVFESSDMVGVELGAALAEAYSISCGIADGLGFGAGTIALLVTRSLAEMARLGAVLGARTDTFSGLSGLGDLVACARGRGCPGFRLGVTIGAGLTLDQAMEAIHEPVEGVHTLRALAPFARRRNVPMPILVRVSDVLGGRLSPLEAATKLITTEAGEDIDVTMDLSGMALPLPERAPRGGAGKG